jgi:hypothetical protein
MEGLFYYHDADELTFIRLYPDGRVIRYGRYTKHDRMFHSYVWFTLEEEQTHMFRGIYQLEKGNGIRIVFKSDFGTMVYRGTILDNNSIELLSKCPFNNFGKSATFMRYSSEHYKIHIMLSDTYAN